MHQNQEANVIISHTCLSMRIYVLFLKEWKDLRFKGEWVGSVLPSLMWKGVNGTAGQSMPVCICKRQMQIVLHVHHRHSYLNYPTLCLIVLVLPSFCINKYITFKNIINHDMFAFLHHGEMTLFIIFLYSIHLTIQLSKMS